MTEKIDRKNYTISALAQKIGRSPSTVVRWTSKPRDEYLRQAENRHKKIQQLRETNKTYQEIADELGVSIGTVHYALKKKGVTADSLQVTP